MEDYFEPCFMQPGDWVLLYHPFSRLPLVPRLMFDM